MFHYNYISSTAVSKNIFRLTCLFVENNFHTIKKTQPSYDANGSIFQLYEILEGVIEILDDSNEIHIESDIDLGDITDVFCNLGKMIRRDYFRIFHCRTGMMEPSGPSGVFSLFDLSNDKQYDISYMDGSAIEKMMKSSIEFGENILLQNCFDKEIPREIFNPDYIY